MIEYPTFTRFGKSLFEGVEILKYKIILPKSGIYEEIDEFYKACADKVVGYCEGELTERAREEYANSELPQKRFRFRGMTYRLAGDVTYEDDKVIFVRLTARLSGFEGGTAVGADAHCWCKEDRRLLPPKQAIRTLNPKGKLPRGLRRCDGVIYSDGKFYSCIDGEFCELEIKK